MSLSIPDGFVPFDPAEIRVRNASKLELAELAGADPRTILYLTPALLFATFPGESIPQDVVDR